MKGERGGGEGIYLAKRRGQHIGDSDVPPAELRDISTRATASRPCVRAFSREDRIKAGLYTLPANVSSP